MVWMCVTVRLAFTPKLPPQGVVWVWWCVCVSERGRGRRRGREKGERERTETGWDSRVENFCLLLVLKSIQKCSSSSTLSQRDKYHSLPPTPHPTRDSTRSHPGSRPAEPAPNLGAFSALSGIRPHLLVIYFNARKAWFGLRNGSKSTKIKSPEAALLLLPKTGHLH